jgi:hypothetical protein
MREERFHPRSRRVLHAQLATGLVALLLGSRSSSASDYYTQAYIGAVDSRQQTNQVAAADVTGKDGGPLRVGTWYGAFGDVLGHAMSGPGALSMSLYAHGGVNNSIGGRCLLWETFVARDSSRPGQPLVAELIVAFSGSETGLPGATGGYARAGGGASLIVPIPYQGGVSTNLSFFGETNLNVSALLSQRFGMVEGAPLTIVAELDLSVGTTGAIGEDTGIAADFNARIFVRPVEATVTVTSASGYAYAVPSTAPANLEARATAQRLALTWPVDHRGWRLVMNTNGVDGLTVSRRWFHVPGASATNEIVIPVDPGRGAAFYQLVWP